jgi:hypothetical protein
MTTVNTSPDLLTIAVCKDKNLTHVDRTIYSFIKASGGNLRSAAVALELDLSIKVTQSSINKLDRLGYLAILVTVAAAPDSGPAPDDKPVPEPEPLPPIGKEPVPTPSPEPVPEPSGDSQLRHEITAPAPEQVSVNPAIAWHARRAQELADKDPMTYTEADYENLGKEKFNALVAGDSEASSRAYGYMLQRSMALVKAMPSNPALLNAKGIIRAKPQVTES